MAEGMPPPPKVPRFAQAALHFRDIVRCFVSGCVVKSGPIGVARVARKFRNSGFFPSHTCAPVNTITE